MSKMIATSLMALAAIVMTCPNAQASLTGQELPHGTWIPNSTNDLNYNKLVPGREGQTAPFVLFESATTNSVTLNFNNGGPGLAFFEIRIDGIQTGATAHPVVTGDTIHSGGQNVASGILGILKTVPAANFVDVRLALGGERDWDFDWVRFNVAPVPEPTTFVVWSLLGVCAMSMRRGRHEA